MGMVTARSHSAHLRRLLDVITALLGVQFIAGMYLNNFNAIPVANFRVFPDLMTQFPVLAVHFAVGVIIFAVSVMIVAMSFKENVSTFLKTMGIMTSLSVLLAGISGMLFIDTGSGLYSFSMAIFWLLAFGFVGFSQSGMGKQWTKAKD